MSNLLKFIGRFIGLLSEWILILLILFTLLIKTSAFQTFIGNQYAKYLSHELNADVSIAKIDIDFFDGIQLEGLVIRDQQNNLLLSVPKTEVKIDDFSILKNFFDLSSIKLSDGEIHISRTKNTDTYNFQFLIDYFSSDSEESSSTKFFCNRIFLDNMKLTFRDEQSFADSDFPMLAELNFNPIFLDVSNFSSNDKGISFNVNNIEFFEKNNQIGSNSSFNARIDGDNFHFSNINLELNETKLDAKYLTLKNLNKHFVFQTEVTHSRIDFKLLNKFYKDIALEDKLFYKGNCEITSDRINLDKFEIEVNNNLFQGDLNLDNYLNLDDLTIDSRLKSSHIDAPKFINFIKGFDSSISFDLSFLNNNELIFDVQNFNYQGSLRKGRTSVEQIKNKNGIVKLKPIETSLDVSNGYVKIDPQEKNWLIIENFDVGSILNNKDIGTLNSSISSDLIFLKDINEFQIKDLAIEIDQFMFNSYNYKNFNIRCSDLNTTNSSIDISSSDPNLNLNLHTNLKLKTFDNVGLDFYGNLTRLNLGELDIIDNDTLEISSDIQGDFSLKKGILQEGKMNISSTKIQNGNDKIELNNSTIEFVKKAKSNKISMNSDFLDLDFLGVVHIDELIENISNDLVSIYPIAKNRRKFKSAKAYNKDKFELNLTTKSKINDILNLFFEDIEVSQNSKIDLHYEGTKNEIKIDATSEALKFGFVDLLNVKLIQRFNSESVDGRLEMDKLKVDSLYFNDVVFENSGKNNSIDSRISWNINGHDTSLLAWELSVLSNELFNINIEPSFFTLNDYRWEIVDASNITSFSDNLTIDSLIFRRNEQEIILDGCITDNKNDYLNLLLDQIDLKEISEILGTEHKLEGRLSSRSKVMDPFKDLKINTSAIIQNLFVDSIEVGEVNLKPNYEITTNKIDFNGFLIFKGINTFNFSGDYSLNSESLNAKLNFENTDIGVANVFLDPDVLKDLKGKLNGEILVKGSINRPILFGTLKLNEGGVFVPITNLFYDLQAKIKVNEDMISINNAPITDDEGNLANLNATVFHNNYSDFNFDVQVIFDSFKEKYRFKVLNTTYKEGEYYFGKAYAKGDFNISGDEDLVRIELNAESKEGTEIVFPIYGAEEYEENEDFIQYIAHNSDSIFEKDDSDVYSGVDMEFNFSVNKNALMKLVFDETTGDQLIARGKGDISLKIDPMYNVNMLGKYNISEGSKYDFAMGSFKQPFDIEPGSSINWNGDVTDAELNVKASMALRRVSLLELSPEQIDRSLANQEIICVLNLKDNLLQPTISFSIEAPKSPESGKALIRKVNEDLDELNKQFFSLLLVKKFQPLKGSITANGSAALDVLETQINDLLGKISGKYKLNVDYGRDEIINETSATLGLKTGFFNDRLLVSGTFGVDNIGSNSSENSSSDLSSSIIGDIHIEYLINEKGTFRLNAFNESSANSEDALNVDNSTGTYTQGIGVSYHEEFHNWKDFKLIQYTLDIFRKEKKYWNKNKKERKKVSVKD